MCAFTIPKDGSVQHYSSTSLSKLDYLDNDDDYCVYKDI